ncbi:hypothetical protein GJ699_22005 [Duganella sp. FT80W]|uniref:PAAR domain-containing protein n=1 Tax=Duganella guangzhouensis TaxID=2666084 RepID=A0A6I2L7M3_9BURK|nr:PAAR domain-containing protein [Duganella guangzhouensis]MRW92676.1 hypothetical protein [Duganella guangzhouensis]
MQRYHITLGASTSAGGKVISASSCCSINGIAVALEGDTLLCPACRSQGKIRIFGPRIPESWNGKQVALQDDLCVCKCTPPPRLIANQSLKCQSVGGAPADDHTATQTASAAREEMQSAALGDDAQQVALRFLDELTQAPLDAKRYRLELSDKVIEGVTDSHGYTQPITAADRSQLLAWQLLD